MIMLYVNKTSVNGRELGVILEKGFIDMVSLISFYDEEEAEPEKRLIRMWNYLVVVVVSDEG